MPRGLVMTFGLLLLLVATSIAAADLPRWDDDSAIIVTPYPRSFAPALESVNLVAQVFHPIDARTDVRWNVSVTDAAGRTVRQFEARQAFWPGEAIQFAPAWNGRDAAGRYLANGMYNVTVEVEMRAISERVRPSEDGDHPRAAVIRQTASAAASPRRSRRRRTIPAFRTTSTTARCTTRRATATAVIPTTRAARRRRSMARATSIQRRPTTMLATPPASTSSASPITTTSSTTPAVAAPPRKSCSDTTTASLLPRTQR